MQVRDIMTRHVQSIRPDASLREAARQMHDLDIGFLPVCDGGRLVGTLTDRDITVRAVAAGDDPDATSVREVMASEVIFSFDDEDVASAARTMKDKQIRRLVVLNRDKRLVGILSLGDLADTGDELLAGNTLEFVSEPPGTNR
ncbi:MAG: CBS domain-containing protein [Gemmataceae bacterium]